MNNTFDSLLSPIVFKAYEGMDNYIIEKVSDKKLAVIYCSSNGIYYPNEYDIFKRYMLDANKFEWIKRDWKIKDAGLNIYIRDVFKQWYIKGINSQINSIDKLINFIKDKVSGYDIIVLGSSAGGYIATILGCRLNAKYVLNFAGQFDLTFQDKNNRYIWEYIENENKTEFKNIKDLIEKSKTDIFYFVGSKSEIDKKDLEVANEIKKNLYIFKFDSKIHGIPFEVTVLKYLINKSRYELKALYDKYKGFEINRYLFEISIVGIYKFLNIYKNKLIQKIVRKI